MTNISNKFSSNTTAFLDAWVRGVRLAGERWFIVDPHRGDDKWDYQPNYSAILKNLGIISSTERAFLIAMYSFFNSRVAQDMAIKFGLGSIGAIIADLDQPRRLVIADLIMFYEGW